jgi:hypothetical protein
MPIMRNPRGNGYVIRGEDGDIQVGSDGSERVYGSAREAQDEQDRQDAWEREESDRRAGGEGGQLAEETDEVEARRASSANPDDQAARMDDGQARSGGYYDPYADDVQLSQIDRDMQGIPLVGGHADAMAAEAEAQRNESGWDALLDFMPTANDLAVEYEEDPGVAADWQAQGASADADAIAAQDMALSGLADVYQGGGLTNADRARMQLGEMEVGRSMRASREADLAALQARGMGGSGAEMASMLGAQQAGADGLFQRDADIQVHAEDRAMDALAGMGSLGSQQRGQSFDESAWNAQNSNDYNRWNTDYERGRSQWNTEQRNASRESRSGARQQAYENRERVQAGKTDQWTSAASGRRADAARNDENTKDTLGGIAGALEELF